MEKRDAAGNLITNDPTGGAGFAQKALDDARAFAAKQDALNNTPYYPPAEAFTQPGWTADAKTGRAVPPPKGPAGTPENWPK